ncbi:MAG: hypothetical protein OXI12_01790 [Gammaproteobacteria bacterium]|nr:hypothetical protein [Gammaproteobacteria bacterium]
MRDRTARTMTDTSALVEVHAMECSYPGGCLRGEPVEYVAVDTGVIVGWCSAHIPRGSP